MGKREEIIERRSERIKHFKLGKGSYAAKIYSRPVHYYDEGSGEYRECDRSLHEDGECWISGNGLIRAKLPKSLEGENRDVGIFRGERYIKWEYLPIRKKKFRDGRLQNASPRQGDESTVYNGVIYPEICKNADLSYEVTENGIKEKIILKAKKRSYKFSFLMTLCGYTAKEGEDGKSVLFEPITAQDEESADTLHMSELFMYDNNGACSDSVSCRLKKINDSKYIITVEPDRSWIESGDRRFPIIIDPTIEYTASFTNNITSRTIASNGSVLYGSSRKVGFESASTEYRTYFEITPASLPDGAVIENVFLNIEWSNPEQMKVLLLCSLSDSVDISTVNWGNKPQEIASIANRIHTMTNSLTANITSAYKASDGALKAVLRAEKNTCDSCSDVIDFLRGDCSLEIEYTVATEEYDYSDYQHQYQEYQQIDAGRGRHGEVNLRTGNLSFEIPLLDPDQCFIPFSISLIYDKSMHYYDSWKLSVDQKLVDAAQNQQGIKKIYTDSAGKEHLLVEDKVGNYTDIIEYSGMQARIYNDYLYDGDILLFDNGIGGEFGDKLHFNSNGDAAFYTFFEKYPKYVYAYDSSHRLISVKVGENKVAQISYDSNGLSGISDNAGHTTSVECNAVGMITSITKYDGSTTSFTYEGKRLKSLTTESGMVITFGYKTGEDKVVSVSYAKRYSSISGTSVLSYSAPETIDTVHITYYDNKKLTAVYGKNNIKTMYLFDDKGRIASVYEDYSSFTYNSSYPHINKPNFTPSVAYSYTDTDRNRTNSLSYFVPAMRVSQVSIDRNIDNNYITSAPKPGITTADMETKYDRGWYCTSNTSCTEVSDVAYISGTNTFKLVGNNGSCAIRHGVNLYDLFHPSTVDGNMILVSAWIKASCSNSDSSKLIFRVTAMSTTKDK